MATIGDVAEEAGVARSTVSAVMSGRKFVRPETKARVEAAIEKLNYSVNVGARALATAKTMTIGVVLDIQAGEFGPALATYLIAVTDAARESGYGVLLLTDPDGESAVRRVITSRQVDGIILLSVVEEDPRIGPIVESKMPAVLIGMPGDTFGIDAVDLDFARAAQMMIDCLVDAEYSSATLVTWPEEVLSFGRTFARRFLSSATGRAKERGLDLQVVSPPASAEDTKETLTRLLSGDEAPRALLVHNETASAMLPLVTRDLALRVPEDLAVLSVHSEDLRTQHAIPYTSVESEPHLVSRLAVETLVARLHDPSAETRREFVAPRISFRDSV